ncbi:MAG: YfhO family protein [Clostridia bacterium]|nr:YfhO family protein [Clostridia bacterium]
MELTEKIKVNSGKTGEEGTKETTVNPDLLPKEKNRIFVHILAFLLPFLAMIIIYAFSGVYPFGEKTVLTIDINEQYSIFLDYFRRVLLGEESLFYAFSKGIGGNMYGLFTYYLSSPFSFLMIFFSRETLPEAIAFIIALKTACAGLTFSIFLKKMFKKSDLSIVIFSCIYALSGYMMQYSMCLMWHDGVIWLPIILLGVERILKGESGLLFVFAYAASMISNYYTGYMNTIFVALWFFSRYFAQNDRVDVKDLVRKVLTIAFWGVVTLLISAVIIIPGFLDILSGKLSCEKLISIAPKKILTNNITMLPKHLFIGQYDSLYNSGNPAIFCGMMCGILVSVFFFSSKITIRKKIATAVVYAIFFLSFFIMKIDMIWHIFQYPNGFPFRYVYTFSLFNIVTAYEGFISLNKNPRKLTVAAFSVYLFIVLDRIIFLSGTIKNQSLVYISFVFIAIYATLIFLMIFSKKDLKKIVCSLILIATFVELTLNGYSIMAGIDKSFHYKTKTSYNEFMQQMDDINEFVKSRTNEKFFRWDKTFSRTRNDGLLHGYNSVTSFISTFNGNTISFFDRMGLLHSPITTRYDGSTIVTDALLGIKFIASEKPLNDEYEEIKSFDKYKIYRNANALPLGFTANEDVLKEAEDVPSCMENQNLFAQAIFGKNYGIPVEDVDINGTSFTCTVPEDGLYYMRFLNRYVHLDVEFSVNGEEIDYPYDNNAKKIFCLGYRKAGDVITATITKEDVMKRVIVYGFKNDEFKNDCMEKVKNPGFKINEIRKTGLSAEAEIKDGEVLFTTIPYEKGWEATANGEKVEVKSAQHGFLALELPVGKYDIELSYHVPGLKISFIISIVSLLGVIIYAFMKKRSLKNDNWNGN